MFIKAKQSYLVCFLTLLIVVLFYGCSTKKNTLISRAYHNTTSHYNGYFNARESVNEGIAAIESTYKEDYTKILPLFIYGNESDAVSAYPQMDKAIEKCSKVIDRHSILIKKVEYCEWIDDSYFLIGKAHFYKKEHATATEMFEFVAKAFKKEDIHYSAMIWLIRTYMEKNEMDKANHIFNLIDNDSEFPLAYMGEYSMVYADYYLKQKNYPLAIQEIKNALLHVKKRKKRMRLLFILAQLYQKENNSEVAISYYKQVVKMNPPYEMAFYARINQALSYDIGLDAKEIKETLRKMLHDEKNKEFYDQIYYALADIAFKEKDIEQGIEYLKLSAASSISNRNQKGLSFLRLANLYFDQPNYLLAQKYYDSTATFINPEHPDFDLILNKKNSLNNLVKDIQIIKTEDSLQWLAGLSEKERNSFIDEAIKNAIEEDKKKKEDEAQNEQQRSDIKLIKDNTTDVRKLNNVSGNGWYFYNPLSIGFGYNEFHNKWGDRKLEDNWRRKDKATTFSFDDAPSDDNVLEGNRRDNTSEQAAEKMDRNNYLQNIPLTEEKMKNSNERIVDAMYDMGTIYNEQLYDKEQAITTFEKLLERFDSCKHEVNTYYQLYRLYLSKGNITKSNYYKDLILTKYPDTEYAYIIINPNYFIELEAKRGEAMRFYEDTYHEYKMWHYNKTIQNCDLADSLYPNNYLSPKYHYLKALAIGNSKSKNEFKEALEEVVKQHPDEKEGQEAKKLIALMNKQDAPPVKDIEKMPTPPSYLFEANTAHNFVLIIPKEEGVGVDEVKNQISNFNAKYFSLADIKITNIFINNQHLISVNSFADKDKAANYLTTFETNTDILQNINNKNYMHFIITPTNYATLFRENDLQGYFMFYEQNYMP